MNPRPRILFFSEPYGIGGITTFTKNILGTPPDCGCSLMAVLPVVAGGEVPREYLNLFQRTFSCDSVYSIGAARAVAAILRETAADVIITQGYSVNTLVWSAALFARIPGCFITVQHGIPFPMGGKKRLLFAGDLLLRRLKCDLTVAVCENTRSSLLERFGCDPSGVATVLNPVPIPPDSSIKKDWKPEEACIFGFASRLVREKGCQEALRAFLKAAEKHNRCRLLICGDGPERRSMEDITGRSGCGDRVEFLGARESLEDFYSVIDVLVFPSEGEGLPYVVLEAMAHGVPVVAAGVGGIPEIITNDEIGWLIPPGDGPALNRVMDDAINGVYDVRTMGLKAREEVKKRFSFEAYYKKMSGLIS
jgi:glycosyltransferase involved in cell wall biosynthesis